MTQRNAPNNSPSPILRRSDNPYLERVMRPLRRGLIIVIIVFFGLVLLNSFIGRNQQLASEHNNSLDFVANQMQLELERISYDLTTLSNDPALNLHLSTISNIAAVANNSRELLRFNGGIYRQIHYIDATTDSSDFGLDYERINILLDMGELYTPHAASERALSLAMDTQESTTIFGDFYLETHDNGAVQARSQLMIDAFMPVIVEGQAVMVIALQIDGHHFTDLVNFSIVDNLDTQMNRRILLFQDATHIVADSNADDTLYLSNINLDEGNVIGDAFYEQTASLVNPLHANDMLQIQVGDNAVYSSRHITGTTREVDWQLVIYDNLLGYYLPIAWQAILLIGLSLLIGFVLLLFTQRNLSPMMQAIFEADSIAQTHAEESRAPVQSTGNQSDLLDSVRRLSTRLGRLQENLQLETTKRTRNMEVTSNIGRETASIADLDTLANRAISLICYELGFYHAQIFLLDESRSVAVLRYSRGEVGEEMIAKGYQIDVGFASVVGTVTAENRAVIINDTFRSNKDPHIFNPLLPDTRAKMGLPLVVGDVLLGALDIQSKKPNVFDSNDIDMFQLIADQLAVGINNAQLRQQSNERIEQINVLNRRLTGGKWQEMGDLLGLQSTYGAAINTPKLSADISIRGHVIGTLEADLPNNKSFTADEQQILESVAERVALAIENARLFQRTQLSLSETQTLYELSRLLNEANSLEDVLIAILNTVATDAAGGQIWLFDELSVPRYRPEWAHVAVDVSLQQRDDAAFTALGQRFQLSRYKFMDSLTANHVTIIEDLAEVTFLDADLAALFEGLAARSLIFIPLNMRGEWKGILSINFAEARPVGEQERRIYEALVSQAGVAIDNRLLLQETEDALNRQERLYAASRLINQAQSLSDLILAAVKTTSDRDLDFRLSLLEGDVDEQGWTQRARLVAYSTGDQVYEANRVHPIIVPVHSPMREREPEILVDPGQDIGDVPDAIVWMREQGYAFVAIFPLFSDNHPLALFYIANQHPYALSQVDYDVYRALTGQMSTQIENRNLLQQTETTLQEISRLYMAVRSITSAQDMRSIYDTVALHLSMSSQDSTGDSQNNMAFTILLAQPQPELYAPQLRYDYLWRNGRAEAHNPLLDTVISQEDAPFGSLVANQSQQMLLYRDRATMPRDFPMLYEILTRQGAQSALIVSLWSRQRWFGVIIIHSDDGQLFDENYIQFVQSLADQVAIAIENQSLLYQTQFERQRLDDILATLPVGVLVLDPETLYPISANAEVETLLRQQIDYDAPFTSERYHIYRSGVNIYYPNDELPIYQASQFEDQIVPSDDLLLMIDDYHIDLVMSAAAIFDTDGKRQVIVAAFQDITVLRSIEYTVQENLRETVILYETQRALNESQSQDDLFDAVITQLLMQQTRQAYILMMDRGTIRLERYANDPIDEPERLRPFLQNEALVIDDLADYDAFDPEAQAILDEINAQALLVIPLKTRNRRTPFGWLMMTESEPMNFSNDRYHVVQSIADMTSQSLDNNYLVENMQMALQETETLYNANTLISRSLNRVDLFEALEDLLYTMEPDDIVIYLLQDQKMQSILNVNFESDPQTGFDVEQVMTMPLPHDNGLFVSDIKTADLDAFGRAVAKKPDLAAFATINLRILGDLGGRILLGYREPHVFDESDTRFLNAIADSTSVVLDNQQLLGQFQSSLQEANILYQASKMLTEANTPQDIVDIVCQHLIRREVNRVFIAMLKSAHWDDQNAMIDIVANWNEPHVVNLLGLSLKPDQFPAWSQLATDSVRIITDIHDARYDLDELVQLSLESIDARSIIILPLRATQMSLGVIWISSSEVIPYDERDKRIYESFAEQTSISLQAQRFLEQTRQRATQLETSSVISQSMGQILDLDLLLPLVVDLIKEQFQYDHVQIFLMDDNNEWAVLEASTGQAGEQLLAMEHKLQRGSQSVIGQVTETGTATIALDTEDADVVHKPNFYLPLTRSEMALPMIAKGMTIGALDVQSNRAQAFDDDDLQVLTTLASQIAVAIDNARLYEESAKNASDMSFLFEMTTIAASSGSLDEALEFIASRLLTNLQADVAAIYLVQTYEDYYGNQKQVLEVTALSSNNPVDQQRQQSYEAGDEQTLVGRVSQSLKPFVIYQIDQHDDYQALVPETQSAVLMPIVSNMDLIGLIAVESTRTNAYNVDTIALLKALTSSLSAVIQNTLLVEQLQQTNEQLREVDRLKSQFLASMSHELRTPLNSIIGFSRVMLKGIDGPLSEMQEQDLTTIYNSGNHLLRLINDILDQAKIEAKELNLKFGYFEIKPLVESVKSIAVGLLKEKPQLNFIVEVADALPKAYGDEFRSRQILLNLVTNAIKFTQDGSVTIRVYAIQGDPEPMLQLDVVDTGIGIEEADLPTVFEQFRQVDSSLTRTVGGTGLGLPISKSLAELQGGELLVSSQVGVGSVFSVTIPTSEGAEALLEEERQAKRQEQRPLSPVPGSHKDDKDSSGLIKRKDIEEAKRRAQRADNGSHKNSVQDINPVLDNKTQSIPMLTKKRDVILVEDNKDMVDRFRRILQGEGFNVMTADFAAFAEAMIGQMRPNLVILDVNFSDGEGWQLLENLKERDDTFDIPVIVTTEDDNSEEAYRLGAHTFIPRPFTSEALLEAVLAAQAESERERIVIIDDQEDTIRLLTHLLNEHSNFKIYSAQSGDEGISLIARRRPDLVILDLRMPGKDGFAVLDELRGNPETAKIPVLVVTGEVDLNTQEQAQLVDIHVLRKTDISQEEYDLFIDNVRSYLESNK